MLEDIRGGGGVGGGAGAGVGVGGGARPMGKVNGRKFYSLQ